MSPIYLYGFVPTEARLPTGGLLGVGDTEVELTGADRLPFRAVISRVDPEEFTGERLERHCADVEWMAELGLHHEETVAWFVDHASILPSRVVNLFSSQAKLLEAAARDAGRIERELERFSDTREWDMKVGYDAEALDRHLAEISDEVAALDEEIEAAKPGKQFLLRKKRADVARREGRAAARRLAQELVASLERLAEDARHVVPPSTAPVLASAAFLVARGREAAFRDRARKETERAKSLGLTVDVTGPWAPYRFLEAPGA